MSDSKIIPVILSGGSGTRLWPLSRKQHPKQYLNIYGENSMLQETILRLDGLDSLADPIVICNIDHRFLVAEQMKQIGITNSSIIVEPLSRNTAPAIAAVGAPPPCAVYISVIAPSRADDLASTIEVGHRVALDPKLAAVLAHRLHLMAIGTPFTALLVPLPKISPLIRRQNKIVGRSTRHLILGIAGHFADT